MKSFRKVSLPLRFAEPCERPKFIPLGRRRQHSAKAAGLRYEAQVGTALGPSALHGQWFHFIDGEGEAWCQPDFLLYDPSGVCFVLEVKLSWVPEAAPKLRGLYLPVVERALQRPARPIVVCRNVEGAPAGQTVLTLDAAKSAACSGACPVLLWLGPKAGQLVPHKRPFHRRGASPRLTERASAR